MTRRRPLLGAVAGLLVVAAALTLAPATRAEEDPMTCPGPTAPDADAQDGLQFVSVRLNTDGKSTEATQPIEFEIRNTAQSQLGRDPKVEHITATIVTCREGQVLPAQSSHEVAASDSRNLSMKWSADFTWNREYDVLIDAKGSRPQGFGTVEQHLQVVKRLHLAVPPKKPTGVKASSADGVVTVSWSNADREPDLLVYEVRRAAQGSSDYVTVKNGFVPATVNSLSDQPGEGAYRYHVIAYRREVDAGTVSSDATAEVAAPAAAAAAAAAEGESTAPDGSSSGGGTGDGGRSGGTTATTTKPTISTGGAGGTVDLSHFAAVLNARRSTPTTRVEPPDPGYQETLPFQVAGDDPAVGAPEELGAGEDDGLGQRLVADPEARRRSLGFVAFGLLLFVLGMTGLFLKGEVNRADELEALTDDGDPEPDPEPEPVPPPESVTVVAAPLPERRPRRPRRLALLGPDPAELDEFTPLAADGAGHDDLRDVLGREPAAGNGSHRRRRTVDPLDAPGLDVPDPDATTTRTNARRASSRLPARPADDRRQGGAAVRAGGRGTGQGDRRVPVGR